MKKKDTEIYISMPLSRSSTRDDVSSLQHVQFVKPFHISPSTNLGVYDVYNLTHCAYRHVYFLDTYVRKKGKPEVIKKRKNRMERKGGAIREGRRN